MPEGSGTGYLRVSNGNALLHVGARSSYAKDNRRKSSEVQPTSQAQVPKELSNSDLGAKHKGSVKSKKDLARNRAQFSSASVADMPKCSLKSISTAANSEPNNEISEQSESRFLFTASARNEVGNFGGDEQKNAGNGHCRSSDQAEKSVDFTSLTHEGESSDGAPDSDGSTLGKEVNAGEAENYIREDEPSVFAKPDVRRSESWNGGDSAISNICQEHQVCHHDNAGVRPFEGEAEADGMEFEGGGENPNSC
nr:hypothetical protein CFP56_77929 [Quercus suber]